MIIYSGFGYFPSVVTINKRKIFTTNVIKNTAHWKNHTESKEAIDEINGQDVGEIRSWKFTVAA